MCGLVGIISKSISSHIDSAIIAMKHRGPDAQGKLISKLGDKYISLGHARLSIIDLDKKANQPYADEDVVIIFNGEIYNYKTLKSTEDFSTFSFKTKSDTEVILAGYKIFGTEIFSKLNGMFSIAILDKSRKKIILARDPFGIKPLYYSSFKKEEFFFASEIKALSIACNKNFLPNANDIAEFLLNGFLYEPKTGLTDVEKVKPGEFIELDLLTMNIEKKIYHDPLKLNFDHNNNFTYSLTKEINLQSEADVPVGIFFSGGIDSSALAISAKKKLNAFFVEYKPRLNDSNYAFNIAKFLDLKLSVVEHSDLNKSKEIVFRELYGVAQGTEEPISNYTYVSTRILSKHAREAGYKVMLSGMGADEIFGGYPRHLAARYWNLFHKYSAGIGYASNLLSLNKKWHKKVNRLKSFSKAENFAMAYTNLVGYFSEAEVSALLDSRVGIDKYLNDIEELTYPVKHKSFLRQAMYLDRFGYLSQNLTYTDKASMAESIEVRVPFLSPSLESYVNDAKDSDLMSATRGKLPLNIYCERYLPKNFTNRPKVGFNPPLDEKINYLGFSFIKDIFLSGKLKNYINVELTLLWLKEHFYENQNHTYRLWQLMYLSLWLDSYGK